MTRVTRVNGSSRDPYPPTTVSLLTKPRGDLRSARTTRMRSGPGSSNRAGDLRHLGYDFLIRYSTGNRTDSYITYHRDVTRCARFGCRRAGASKPHHFSNMKPLRIGPTLLVNSPNRGAPKTGKTSRGLL